MKKFIYYTCVITFLLLFSMAVYADMGAPEIRRYKATPKDIEGAPYYEHVYDSETDSSGLIKVGTIQYGEIVEVDFETVEDGVRYGYFTWKNEDGKVYYNYEIRLEDLIIANLEEDKPVHSDIEKELIVLTESLSIHSGPAYIYDVIGSIPFGTRLNGYRIAYINTNEVYDDETQTFKQEVQEIRENDMNPWFYVEYNGISGWICELQSAVGVFVDKNILIKSDLSFSGDEIAIPASTKIKGYYQTDMWSRDAYITYEGKGYIISMYDCAVDTSEWRPNDFEIKYDGAKMYRTASKESTVLIDSIPKGTLLPIKYQEYDLRWIGWIYTEYNGVEGWVIYFDDDNAMNEYLNGEYELYDEEKGTAKLVEEVKTDVEADTKIIEPAPTKKDDTKVEEPIVSNTVVYIGIAIIIALTALVIILLLSKNKK